MNKKSRMALIQQLIDDPDPPPFNIDDLANESQRVIAALCEARGPEFKTLKKGRAVLTDDERAKVMQAKAVWHHGPQGQATPAVWKSIVNGVKWFTTNTHRAFQSRPTLAGAIDIYHSFIKSTA